MVVNSSKQLYWLHHNKVSEWHSPSPFEQVAISFLMCYENSSSEGLDVFRISLQFFLLNGTVLCIMNFGGEKMNDNQYLRSSHLFSIKKNMPVMGKTDLGYLLLSDGLKAPQFCKHVKAFVCYHLPVLYLSLPYAMIRDLSLCKQADSRWEVKHNVKNT